MVDDPNINEGGSFIDDEDFLAADVPVTETITEKRNLKEIWDQNPSLKIFAGVAVLAVVIIGYIAFSGDNTPAEEQTSNVRPTAEVSQPPGTAELPPAYEEAVRQASQQRAEQAAASGGSAIPTPIARPSERIEAPVQVEDTDPLSEWRREAEARRMERQQVEDQATSANLAPPPALPTNGAQFANPTGQVQGQGQPNPPLPTGPSPEQIGAITQQLQQFMTQNVIEPQTPKESVVLSMNIQPGYDMKKYFPPEQQNAAGTTASNGTAPAANGTSNTQAKPKPIIPAGTIAYAQILTEANSDVPGPVLAEVASGPLAGGRAIGQFQVSEKHLVVQFQRVVKDGVEYNTSAYALDPATTLPGMATDVNHHYLSRILLPAAADFIQGFAQAAAQTNTDVVVTNGTVITNNTNDLNAREELMQGVNAGAQRLSTILQSDAERPVTVRIRAGTRVGLLFVNSVIDPNDPNATAQQQGNAPSGNTPLGQAYNAFNAANSYSNNNSNNNSPTQNNTTMGAAGSYAAVQQQQQPQNSNVYVIGRPLR